MSRQLYVPFFAINPYGDDTPAPALHVAMSTLESQLGGDCQVLAAKAAFEEAGGFPACWQGHCPPNIVYWTRATRASLGAALRTEPPRQATIEDLNPL